ncbi:choline BCCT transporter BetT [Arthrobacter sp. I2-34]|uniref:Choline BCCT transporter BetT n=1 Tax=Arthrobacter hankyongi TaxID=2904801 RepID=A0ABS9L8F0_9MICC|nr:choline BCCT transporter BetT [Arthrobacter hankyongi]MCG2622939.1 choline BCCT transporter BetT [Arthrobacter hankyongi]
MPDAEDKRRTEDEPTKALVERRQLGGTERRRPGFDEENRPPVSSQELIRGPAELTEEPGPRINWRVFIIASAITAVFSVWAMLTPTHAAGIMHTVVEWIAENLGWYYVLTVTLVILFVLWVAFSKEGSVRLGPDHSRPQYKLFTWVAMLFAAGVGIDLLFYSVTGPITQYVNPPAGEGQTAAAAQDAVVWTMFHYGIAGWSIYALLGMAMGYFAYRWGMPLSIRAALYPLLGKRVRGAAGDVIDIVALVGTVFGVATSMGIGVVLLNVGFAWLFGLQQGLALQIALVIVAVVMTVAACTSGVDRGIRWISELNIWSAAAMLLYILVTGRTSFLLNAIVENIGRFVLTLPARTLQTFAYEEGGSEWMAAWTLFFWAFWLAWGPFVGLFLARISRGRTLREFVIAAITAPVLCDFLIVTIFGNSALHEVLNGNKEFARLAMDSPEQGWYALLEMFPGAAFLIGLATLSGLLFYLTSANSGAMVMSNFSSSIPDPSQDGAKWLRIFWAVLTALLTIAMLVAGGVTTMEYATLIFALPVTVIAYLVMASFSKVLRMERADREGQVLRRHSMAAHGGYAPERTWRQRLAGMRAYPSKKQVAQFMERTVQPALGDVVKEFAKQGYQASLDIAPNEQSGIASHVLVVTIPDHRSFLYQVQAVEAPVPMFGGRMSRETDVYYRVEVFTQTGSEGYDLMGVTRQQVIDDVLDRYEAHLGFLTYSSERDYASVLTPPVDPVTGGIMQVQPAEEPDDEAAGGGGRE